MKVVIANWLEPGREANDIKCFWAQHKKPPRRTTRLLLFEFPIDWGFHIFAIGLYLMGHARLRHQEPRA